jgi:hypothetical protein
MSTTGKTGERATLSTIREAYFKGDFEACLMMCDAFVARDAKDAAELVLFSAAYGFMTISMTNI